MLHLICAFFLFIANFQGATIASHSNLWSASFGQQTLDLPIEKKQSFFLKNIKIQSQDIEKQFSNSKANTFCLEPEFLYDQLLLLTAQPQRAGPLFFL